MPIANYSTKIPAAASIAEIQQMLAESGAQSVMIDYEQGSPTAVSFALNINGSVVGFQLPARAHGVLVVLDADEKVPDRLCTIEHAREVAWRVVKDWVRAQLALVESGQVQLAEAMLPYAVTNTGRTLYAELEERGPGILQLGPASE